MTIYSKKHGIVKNGLIVIIVIIVIIGIIVGFVIYTIQSLNNK
jgi:hypothetical protein